MESLAYDWNGDLLNDVTRVGLIIGWAIAAWMFWQAGKRSNDASWPLRKYAAFVSVYWVVFYSSVLLAWHTSITTEPLNEFARLGIYLSLSVMLTWAFLSCKQVERDS